MITNYLEITHEANGSRNLVPIESVGAVAEVKRDIKTIKNGIETIEKITKCRVLVLEHSYYINESYDDIKQQINKIGAALRQERSN